MWTPRTAIFFRLKIQAPSTRSQRLLFLVLLWMPPASSVFDFCFAPSGWPKVCFDFSWDERFFEISHFFSPCTPVEPCFATCLRHTSRPRTAPAGVQGTPRSPSEPHRRDPSVRAMGSRRGHSLSGKTERPSCIRLLRGKCTTVDLCDFWHPPVCRHLMKATAKNVRHVFTFIQKMS